MFKVSIKSNLRAQMSAKMKNFVNDQLVQEVESQGVGEIKRLISSGTSPVRSVEGGRRFKGYKNPHNYPGTRKAKRPANLYLSGEMLKNYVVRQVNTLRISLGIPPEAPQEVKVRAIANNEGTTNSAGQVAIAARRFIPLNGETYAVSVVRKLKTVYAARVKALLSR